MGVLQLLLQFSSQVPHKGHREMSVVCCQVNVVCGVDAKMQV